MADRLVQELLAGVASNDPGVRERSASQVTDVHRSLPSEDVHALAAALIDARLVEELHDAQEAQLHALAELAEWHELPRQQIERLADITRPTNDPSQDEYLSYLIDGSA